MDLRQHRVNDSESVKRALQRDESTKPDVHDESLNILVEHTVIRKDSPRSHAKVLQEKDREHDLKGERENPTEQIEQTGKRGTPASMQVDAELELT